LTPTPAHDEKCRQQSGAAKEITTLARGGPRARQRREDRLAFARSGARRGRIEDAISKGRVKVDGRVVRELFFSLAPTAKVELDGRRFDVAPRTRVLMFHKPAGVVTSAKDEDGSGTVFDALNRALPEALQHFGWHAVGRLDRDTTGLLLFTTDERFVEHATSPRTHLPKRYVATVAAEVTPKALAALEAGLTLTDGPTLPASARARGKRVVALTLTEGRHHQVKRMLSKVGLPVVALHREAIGTLDVELGAFREVGAEELREKLSYQPR
jgi:pseudouridine synthase